MKLISQILAVATVATLVVPAFAQTSTMKPMPKKPMMAKKMTAKQMMMQKKMASKKMMMKKPMMHSTMKPMAKPMTKTTM